MKKRVGLSNKVPNLVITPLKGISVEELMEYEPILDLVRKETPRGIQRAIESNKQDATIMEVNNSGYCIEIPYKFWKNALNACMEYYTDEEDFEKCIEIKEVLSKLDQYNKIPTTIRNKSSKSKRNGQ